ncbi:MAG: PEGA domain-containing protein [Vicinamibacterales bacterium]
MYRPYYSFRPRFNLGFRLFVGYPVAYPVYYYPYAYAAPVPVPGAAGGLSFDIAPATAEIFVDGRYMGLVEDYSSNMQPLSLAPGRHRIEIHEEGFEPLTFDADVLPGQVIPFQGAMEPQ